MIHLFTDLGAATENMETLSHSEKYTSKSLITNTKCLFDDRYEIIITDSHICSNIRIPR